MLVNRYILQNTILQQILYVYAHLSNGLAITLLHVVNEAQKQAFEQSGLQFYNNKCTEGSLDVADNVSDLVESEILGDVQQAHSVLLSQCDAQLEVHDVLLELVAGQKTEVDLSLLLEQRHDRVTFDVQHRVPLAHHEVQDLIIAGVI